MKRSHTQRTAARKRCCHRKVKYIDPRAAILAIRTIVDERPDTIDLHIYRCKTCGGLHLGNVQLSKHQKRRRSRLELRDPIMKFLAPAPNV